jgi:hypothetical protein
MISIVSLLASATLLYSPLSFTRAGLDSPEYHVVGKVTDVSGLPIADVELSVIKPEGLSLGSKTSKDGRFAIRDIPTNHVSIQLRRLGYEARTIELDLQTSVNQDLDITLKPIPQELDEIQVRDFERASLKEFYDRKAMNKFAKFFEHDEIEKKHILYLSELLRSIAGAKLTSDGVGNRVMLRDCKPMIWVDGMRAPGAELDEVARPSDVAGIEIYASSAGLPPSYQERGNRMCGAIFVWSRSR